MGSGVNRSDEFGIHGLYGNEGLEKDLEAFCRSYCFICHFIIFYHIVYLDSLHQKTS